MCTIFRENTVFGFKKRNCILLANGTQVPKNVGEADLMFVLLKNVHLIGIVNGVPISVVARSKAWFCGHSLAGIWARIPLGVRISVSCDCSVLYR
jgi:hypothetical protein